MTTALKTGFNAFLKEQVSSMKKQGDEKNIINTLRIARSDLMLNENEEAVRWLERTLDRPNFFLPYIAVDPLYDPIRSNPRFQNVLHHINLN